MVELKEEEYYEHANYRELLKLQPDNFYLHLPFQVLFTKWFFETRLQLLMILRLEPNYFGMRHILDPQAQWFSDWVFLNHYQLDYLDGKKWKPSLLDRIRYQWLMRQGYAKEQKDYLDLIDRNDERKITVQERKFLKKYAECHYWSYIDCAHDDELAFFRMGVDSDESLQNEDKPLFPNIAYSYPDDPRLAYLQGGKMVMEYIPKYKFWPIRQIVKLNVRRKWQKGRLVTYADIRALFNPETIKIHDIEFIFHVFGEHGGKLEDPRELKMFNELYMLYGKEIIGLARAMHFPEFENFNIAYPKKQLNPLYIAYKQRWIGRNKVKEFQKLFHGVTKEEYQDIVNKQYESLADKPQKKSKKKPSDKETKKRVDDLITATIKQK